MYTVQDSGMEWYGDLSTNNDNSKMLPCFYIFHVIGSVSVMSHSFFCVKRAILASRKQLLSDLDPLTKRSEPIV